VTTLANLDQDTFVAWHDVRPSLWILADLLGIPVVEWR